MPIRKKTIGPADESQPMLMLRGGRHDPPCFKDTLWRPTPLSELPSWSTADRVGFDFETKDTTLQELGPGVRRPGNRIIGYSFCLEKGAVAGPRYYVPVAHGCIDPSDGPDDGRNGHHDNVEGDPLGYLRDQFKDFEGDVVGANLPYDLDWAWENGILMPKVRKYLDVQVADPLLYELFDYYSLDAIAHRRGKGGKNETALREAARQYGVDPKKDMWRLPGRCVGPYAEDDSVLPLQIMRDQERQIDDEGIRECWTMECKLLPILVRMTRKGVRVDEERLDKVEAWTRKIEAEQLAIVARETGIAIPVGEIMNVDLLACALKNAGLQECIGQNLHGDSVTKGSLTGVDHPVAKALVRARQVSTVRTTFVAGTRKHLTGPAGDRRIHCSFNQIRKTDDTTGDSSGVAYGRLSASHVNMQNQPGNSRWSGDNELGPMWRSIYRAEPGEEWDANDLKQQEPKWSFHYGAILEERGVQGVRGALALCKALHDNPQLDTYEPIVDLAGVPRAKAKVIWLARAYGKGDGGLCEDLGLETCEVCFSRPLYYAALERGLDKYTAKSIATVPVDSPEGQLATNGGTGGFTWKGAGPEGRELIAKFDEGMSFLKVAAGLAKDIASERGYVMLLSGRRCHFEESKKGGKDKYDWTNKAFNRIIQGTSAEQTKRITIAIDEAGYGDTLMLQVHDELDSSVKSPEQARAIAEVMRCAVPMKVPTIVDVELGPSWGESMGVEYINAQGKKDKVQYRWGMHIENGVPVYHGDII